MAYTKIIKLDYLRASINYILKNEKTNNGEFVASHGCSITSASEDFEAVNAQRKQKNYHAYSVKQWMIIQSFPAGEVDYKTAFEITKKLAEKYLGDDYQYVLATHTDTDHVNCHIVFNATNQNTYKSFDSKGLDFIWRLQRESDELCKQYGLGVIENKKQKGITQKEYYARKHARSYKAKLLDLIDDTIPKSADYDDFLLKLGERCGVIRQTDKSGERRHILLVMPGSTKGIRIDTLGREDLNYSPESIKYRIRNVHLESTMIRRFRRYNLEDNYFKGENKKGLRRWAESQNLMSEITVATELAKRGENLATFKENTTKMLKEMNDLNEDILLLDDIISGKEVRTLERDIKKCDDCIEARKTASEAYKVINQLKKYKSGSKEYADFRKANAETLIKYDKAKKLLNSIQNPNAKGKNKWYSTKEFEERKVELSNALNKALESQETAKEERDIKFTQYETLRTELFKRDQTQRYIEGYAREENKKY